MNRLWLSEINYTIGKERIYIIYKDIATFIKKNYKYLKFIDGGGYWLAPDFLERVKSCELGMCQSEDVIFEISSEKELRVIIKGETKNTFAICKTTEDAIAYANQIYDEKK